MKCVCVLGCGGVVGVGGLVGERIAFGIYQSCINRGNVGHVYVFGLRWCGWIGPGSGRVVWCYVCVFCQSGLFV